MLKDIKTNVALIVGHLPASRSGASLVGSAIVNIGAYLGGSFILNVGTISTGGSYGAKLQYSSSATFASDVNDDDGSKGNTAPVTSQSTSDTATRFHIQKPFDDSKPYYRLAVTDAGAAVLYSSVFVGAAKVTPVSYS